MIDVISKCLHKKNAQSVLSMKNLAQYVLASHLRILAGSQKSGRRLRLGFRFVSVKVVKHRDLHLSLPTTFKPPACLDYISAGTKASMEVAASTLVDLNNIQ
jgi:hypothetical protein